MAKISKRVVVIIAIVATFIGVAAIVLGIVLPLALNDEYVDKYVNPQAKINLSNGMTLEFEIWEEECPNAATNFIWLASIGYFNGTILHDGTNGWVRMGGFLPDSTHRGDDTDFADKLPDAEYKNRDGKTDVSGNKFGYRLKVDTKRQESRTTVGALSFCYQRSATEFQIAADEKIGDTIDGDNGSAQKWDSSVFAFAANSETIEKIRAIYALDRDDGTKFEHSFYRAPLSGGETIKITSVKVTEKYAPKWKNFSFVKFFDENNMGSWYTSQKKTGAT